MLNIRREGIITFALCCASLMLCPLWVQGQTRPLSAEYLAQIERSIDAYLIYPEEAILNGWEGVVEISFVLDADGQISELDIAQSSGYPLLDEAAIQAVENASPYPYLELAPDEEIEISLPISFLLPIETLDGADILIPDEPYEMEPYLEAGPLESTLLFHPPEELQGYIQVAIENNQPAQIAQEEIELAKLKIRESRRNLYPALKLQGYSTSGEVYRLKYDEQEIKIQLDQPLYYSGRLTDSIKQSEVNLKITEMNYARLWIDVAHKTEVAYYNYVGSKMNLKMQKEILWQAEEILEIIRKQDEGELITALEAESAQSWYEQINFQIDSTIQDMAMAELTFMQVLNAPERPKIMGEELALERINFNLNECIASGFNSRPEVYLSSLLVRFNEYGKKIEQAKNDFSVDFASSFGRYQGAWETEETESSNNWYVGIKASKPWGPNTMNASITTDESQPRFGQTSATKSTTMSAEFNLLDNLKGLSEEKKAEVELERAISDLNETFKTVKYEIKDAYLNYKKALLQASTAQSEAKYRQRQAKVTLLRAQVGEVGFSNVLEVLTSLSRAQAEFTQALANYYISLANLKKAAGLYSYTL